MRTCSIQGCDRKHYALGLCSMHHQRKWKHGDPLVVLQGFKGKHHTEEAKKKLSLSRIGKPGPMLGKKFSEQHRKNLSASHVDVSGTKNPNFGKHPIPWNKGIKRTDIAGERNHNWKGRPFGVNHAIRTSFEYKMWRTAIFQRDNYTCILCGKRGAGILHVDHYPRTFAEIIDKNNITSIEQAVDCSELWDIKNNRTLCVPCHKQVHYAVR